MNYRQSRCTRCFASRWRSTSMKPEVRPGMIVENVRNSWIRCPSNRSSSSALTIEAAPCLRLLELKFPLVQFLRSSDKDERIDPPAPRRSFVAIGRSNYRVHLEEISFWQFAFLRACEHATSSYPAVQVAARESGREVGEVLADVAVWLPVAFGLGFLRPVV